MEFLWRVSSDFFQQGVGAINRDGFCNTNYSYTDGKMFVWSNVLAVHPSYSDKAVVDFARTSAQAHAKKVRKSQP